MAAHISIQWDDDAMPAGAIALEDWLRRGVQATLRAEDITHAEISLTLLSDAAIAAMSRQWLNHDAPTDVLAFPLYEEGEAPVGDVYIGIEQAARQAEENGVPLTQELVRLAIHGTLHVLGYDHEKGAARTTGAMWRKQEQLVGEVMAS
jgi:probable rRNA maturation factor